MQTSVHHHIRWVACRWGHEGPGRGRDSKLGLPTSVSGRARLHKIWLTTGCLALSGSPEQVHSSCCGIRSPGASCSYRPLCPPALPTVSATPGTHMPCGNRIRLVLPSKETAGPDGGWETGEGEEQSCGQKAGAALAGQGESGSLYCCVTLNS